MVWRTAFFVLAIAALIRVPLVSHWIHRVPIVGKVLGSPAPMQLLAEYDYSERFCCLTRCVHLRRVRDLCLPTSNLTSSRCGWWLCWCSSCSPAV
jgi:hypothetical protein